MVKQYIALSKEKLEELKKNSHKISDFIWEESKEEDKLDSGRSYTELFVKYYFS